MDTNFDSLLCLMEACSIHSAVDGPKLIFRHAKPKMDPNSYPSYVEIQLMVNFLVNFEGKKLL